jgi:hypothetical protein
MQYRLVLPPELGLEPADFVATWNDEQETRYVAEARLSPASSRRFDPTLATVAIELAIGVSSGVASAGIYDLIKKVVAKKGVQKHTQIVELDQPDGSKMLIMNIDEQ